MSKRSPKSVSEKLEIVLLHLEEGKSLSWLTRNQGISKDTLLNWIRKYKEAGVEGLEESRQWKKYSKELKEQAVSDYLNGLGSLKDLTKKDGISDPYVLRLWIKRHTSGKELKATSKGMRRMKQGRKTTFEERIEIVNFTLAHEKDYQRDVEKYGVSYQQVYSWVRKFEKEGSNGLLDRRGKGLESKPNLTPEEELRLKIKQQEEPIKYLEMENGLLKKLEEIKRRNQKKRIRHLMHILGLRSIIRRAKGYCTKTSFVNVEDNILNRNFTATAPNQKWCTDVTFLKYGLSCRAYLSAIKDLYAGSIVAYVVGQFNDNELVLETLRKVQKANPNTTPLIHSDRGLQYTSKDYYCLTTQYQMTRSMSRVGKCIDNAPMESFFGHFKMECNDLKKYKTFEELVSDIDAYIYFTIINVFKSATTALPLLK